MVESFHDLELVGSGPVFARVLPEVDGEVGVDHGACEVLRRQRRETLLHKLVDYVSVCLRGGLHILVVRKLLLHVRYCCRRCLCGLLWSSCGCWFFTRRYIKIIIDWCFLLLRWRRLLLLLLLVVQFGIKSYPFL